MLKLIQSTLALAALAGLATPALAATTVCGKRADFVKALHDQYKEKREALGISKAGHLTEVFVSGTGSWTIIVTTKQGLSCIVASGQHWNGLSPAAVKEAGV